MEQKGYLRHIQNLKYQSLVFLLLLLAGFVCAGVFYFQLQTTKNKLAEEKAKSEQLYIDQVALRIKMDSIATTYVKLLAKCEQRDQREDTTLANSIRQTLAANRYAGYLVYLQQSSRQEQNFSKLLLDNLRKREFEAPGIETMNKKISNRIYYFHDTDKPVADELLRIIQETSREAGVELPGDMKVEARTNIKAPVKQLEIWIDLPY